MKNKEVKTVDGEINNVYFEDIMKQSYINYAMSVITDRALPDVRDGLKPVQRRILYSMKELNNLPHLPYKKSARIVGDCMGKYHPHGDSSIYDAMVRMSQDFMVNTPLVDGQGNFGSIDGDTAAAMRYCLTGDSLINTKEYGLIPIKRIIKSDVNSTHDINLTIQSLDEKSNIATKFFNSGYHKIIKLETKYGYSLRGSYNHPILIKRGHDVTWSRLDALREDDLVAISTTNIFNKNQPIDKLPLKYRQLHLLGIGIISEIIDNKLIFRKYIENTSTIFLPINKIVYEEEEDIVYSIRVDSNCHSFVANGFINHNTESRMTPIAVDMVSDLDKDTVDFQTNFDESLKEPSVLPVRFPNLLINGTQGIAVGISSSIPPHNLSEVIDGTIDLIRNPNRRISTLMNHIQGPDFPTGAIITNKDDLLKIYETGNGSITVRAKISIEDIGYGKHNFVIEEIPYGYSGRKEQLLKHLVDLKINNKLQEVSDIRDESNKDGVRIVLETIRGTNLDKFENKLYSETHLESNVSFNFIAIQDGEPKKFNLKEYLEEFIDFQREIFLRKYRYLLIKEKDRKEIVEGLLLAHSLIDSIIDTIKGSNDIKTAKKCLMNGDVKGIKFKDKKNKDVAKTFSFTEAQANSILSIRLQRLVALEEDSLKLELKEKLSNIKEIEEIINKPEVLDAEIIKELNDIKKKYGEKRRTSIKNLETIEYVEEIIEKDLYFLMDRFGYIRTIDENIYNRANEEFFEDYKEVIKVKNTDTMYFFTNSGYVNRLEVLDIPETKLREKGETIYNIFDLKNEYIVKTMIKPNDEKQLLFITEEGYIKLVKAEELNSNRRELIATKLRDNDTLVDVIIVNDDFDMVSCISKNGLGIKFSLSDVPELGKNTYGVKSMELNKKDKVIRAFVFNSEEPTFFKHKDGDKIIETRLNSLNIQNRPGIGRPITEDKFSLVE